MVRSLQSQVFNIYRSNKDFLPIKTCSQKANELMLYISNDFKNSEACKYCILF